MPEYCLHRNRTKSLITYPIFVTIIIAEYKICPNFMTEIKAGDYVNDEWSIDSNEQNNDALAKHVIKDSVFGDLFSDKKYLRQLYLALHPEDSSVTEDDLTDVTIKNVFLNGQFNDLGFTCRERFIILLECQSRWSANIIIRILLYLAETYQRYIQSHDMDLYGSRKVALPEPELYMLYVGDRKTKPETLVLSEEFFHGKDHALEVKVNVLYGEDEQNIIGQYVIFTKVYSEQRKKYGATDRAVREAIRICKDKNVLRDYLESREQEVIRIMSLLFDQDEIMRIHDVNLTAEVTKNVTKQEQEKSIQALVSMCKKLGGSILDATESVVSDLGITEQEADIIVRKYW